MTKYLCWICGKEIFTHKEQEERRMMAGIKIEEICTECEKMLVEIIEKLK